MTTDPRGDPESPSCRPGRQIRTYYDRYWSDHGHGPEGGLAPTTREILESRVPPGTAIVDVGCGDGRAVGLWASERGCEYLGFDAAQTAVDKTRALGLRAERIEDASSLPLPDGSAPVATAIEVLEHLFDPLATAIELRRILSPDGLLIASVPNAAYWGRRVELGLFGRFNPYGHERSVSEPWIDPHIRFFTFGRLRSMLERAGFQHVEVRGGAHPVFSVRTRIEASGPYRLAMKRWPALLAPTLLAVASGDGQVPN